MAPVSVISIMTRRSRLIHHRSLSSIPVIASIPSYSGSGTSTAYTVVKVVSTLTESMPYVDSGLLNNQTFTFFTSVGSFTFHKSSLSYQHHILFRAQFIFKRIKFSYQNNFDHSQNRLYSNQDLFPYHYIIFIYNISNRHIYSYRIYFIPNDFSYSKSNYI